MSETTEARQARIERARRRREDDLMAARARIARKAAERRKLARQREARERAKQAALTAAEAARVAAVEERKRQAEARAELRADRLAEDDREMLLALYDHPATGRLVRLVNAGRWEPEIHAAAWLEAAQDIPEDLRQFALAIRREYDPLDRIATKIASLGGDTLAAVGRLYGLSRERIRQVMEGALRKLEDMPEVRALRNHMGRDADNWSSVNREAE